MERRSGVVCADLIELWRADITLFIMYSLKRLAACVTFPGLLKKKRKKRPNTLWIPETGDVRLSAVQHTH
jgi:hypothetical protein